VNLFLDTSALIKIYHREKGTEEISNYLSNASESLVLTISDITKIELHSALMRRFRKGEISYNNLSETFQLFDIDFRKFSIVTTDRFVKNLALYIIDSQGINNSISTLDSIQLASAVYSNSYSKIERFVSSDQKMLNVAKEFFQVINPEDL
jgi:predicted nucleic acid-binding protein